mmetsp:Transcript_15285/g.36452  ORF Transcript_15285/g.36452 Transcript_15285/m.36452 type:complete len:81 (+) Transcript_15285:33-275(+)
MYIPTRVAGRRYSNGADGRVDVPSAPGGPRGCARYSSSLPSADAMVESEAQEIATVPRNIALAACEMTDRRVAKGKVFDS